MQFAIDIAFFLIYFLLFLLLCTWTWRFWMMYINQKFIDKLNADSIMLEIKLPREITKSPYAMEVALATLIQGSGISNKFSRMWSGNLPLYSSLEIASLEGVIHFYVRLHKKFKPLVTANLYAQYPGIEIVEADDYTKLIRYHHLSKDVSCWGTTYTLGASWKPTNPETGKAYSASGKKEPKDDKDKYSMPADFLPIKTYVDYELNKNPEEEVKVDPITPLLEFMGSIKRGEYFWFQILVQDESAYNGTSKFPKHYVNTISHEHVSLSDMAKARKDQIRTDKFIKKGDPMYDKYGDIEQKKAGKDADGNVIMVDALHPKTATVSKKDADLTMEEKEEIEAINRKLSKPLVCAVMRLMYVTKRENFDGRHVQNTLSFPKPYKGSNSFSATFNTDPYEYPWQKMGGRDKWRAEEMFDSYVEREGFFPHIGGRETLDKWEDMIFNASTMKNRKMFRMIYESIFHPFDHPEKKEVFTLNLEELATLWHFPGAVAGTPTLPRIDSVKGVAPSNLPV